MMNTPLVSVMMNCWNGSRYLSEAMDCVFAQTYQNWEIVFWDNASTDNSGDIARSYGEKIRYFRSDVTTNLGAARNQSFLQCKGEYIAILDVDDLWEPEKLERQVSLFEKNQKLGIVVTDSICFDDKGDLYRIFETAQPKRGNVFGDLLDHNFFLTVSMMYKKKVLDALPYIFDDEFSIVMDYDLSLRVAYSHELDYIDSPLAKNRIHQESLMGRKRFLRPKETSLLIEKLSRELPDMKFKFKEEMKQTLKLINQQLSLEQWSEGSPSKARQYLSPYLTDPKCLITYLCSFILPFKLFDEIKLAKIRHKIKTIFRD